MKVEIEAKVNGATVFIRDDSPDQNIYCCEEVKFGDNYETRLRQAVDAQLVKAEHMQAQRDQYEALTIKVMKEYET